jgi:hypothetical protein
MPNETTTRKWASGWLSKSRFDSYLRLCDGNPDIALQLHEWNLKLGQALMGDIAHFELALRNSYDRVLRERFAGNKHWLYDEDSPVIHPIMRKSKTKILRDVNLVNRRAISDAKGRAHDPSNPNQVVSGLMLGFWAHMTDRSRERDLWIPYLHHAWPTGTNRATLNLKLERINKLRNRVAHNERLFDPGKGNLSPKLIDSEMLELMSMLCPKAFASIYGDGRVTTLERFIEINPAPVPISL